MGLNDLRMNLMNSVFHPRLLFLFACFFCSHFRFSIVTWVITITRLLRVTDYNIEVNGATRLRVSGRQQQRHQYAVKLLDQAILVSMPYNQDKAFGVASYGTQNSAVAQQVIVFHESATVAHAISSTLAEEGQTKINDFLERNTVAALVILNENGEEKRYTSALFRRFLS